jgi:hypothetical protein
MEAWGTDAPLGSRTRPVTEALVRVSWAWRAPSTNTRRVTATETGTRIKRNMESPAGKRPHDEKAILFKKGS